ncbi:uncharacterized protein G6M90_00g061270 [Metarhizium brunneum]|uniref:NB-ARC domain-containing protein n=1 Tax=Metarhizium brunneum TaxID=500148 RepID=A0A7D5UWT8_9HYPO|nr:hypothetical protein G6M90_00g061270 [Metarhizium brunneum]
MKVTRPLNPEDYHIAIIAPLEIENVAATLMLDNRHDGRFPMARGYEYLYTPGEMGGHNVIVATLPAGEDCDLGSAAALSRQVKTFFPNLWFGLLVGVAAGMPNVGGGQERDIRRGDVLVAQQDGELPGLINLELGKWTENGFVLRRRGWLDMTDKLVRSAIRQIQAGDFLQDQPSFLKHYQEMMGNLNHPETFADPGQDLDLLYETGESVVKRRTREAEKRTRVWYGMIGSASTLVENASKRDELRDKHNLVGIETAAAGIVPIIPVGVVRGVCDYADERTNEAWLPYAAAMAAAYAKEIILQIGPPERPRRVCSLSYAKNLCFVGRENTIDNIRHKLFSLGVKRVALSGLGGMGKTQVALEMAHRVKEAMEDYSVIWMPAQTMAAFEQAAAELVQTLGISSGLGENPPETLQAHLSSDASGPWFLVVDGVDDMSLVDATPDDPRRLLDCLPQSPRGRMLITTRTSAVANSLADPQNVVKLIEMSLGEGKRYLETCLSDNRELRRDDVDETLSCLMERLEYLPLAVAQAVTYMNVNCMSVSEFVRHHGEMEQDRDNTGPTHLFGSQLRSETFHSRSQGSILTTWYASFMAIRNTSAHAAQLLSFLRWTSPKGIPTSVLPLGRGPKKAEAINLLCSYNFLSRREGGRILDMHRLVHLALRSCSKQLFDEEQTQETISHLNRVSPIFPNEHVQKQELWHIQLQLVSAHDKIGKFKDADKLVEHVRATMKEAFKNTEMPWY